MEDSNRLSFSGGDQGNILFSAVLNDNYLAVVGSLIHQFRQTVTGLFLSGLNSHFSPNYSHVQTSCTVDDRVCQVSDSSNSVPLLLYN